MVTSPLCAMNAEDEGIGEGRHSPVSQHSRDFEQEVEGQRAPILGGFVQMGDRQIMFEVELDAHPGMRVQFQLAEEGEDDRNIIGGRMQLLPHYGLRRPGYAEFERERAGLEEERQRLADTARELEQRWIDLQLADARLQEERRDFELMQKRMEQDHQARQEEVEQREREVCVRQAEYERRETLERQERERQQELQRLEFERQERARQERESAEYLDRCVPEAQRLRAYFEGKFHEAFKGTQYSAEFFFAQYKKATERRPLDGGYTLERLRQGVRDYVRLPDDESLLIRFAQQLMKLCQTPSQLDNREQVIRTFLGLREKIEVGHGLSRTTDRERSPQEPVLAGVFDLLAPFVRQYYDAGSRERQLPDVSSTLRRIIHEARTAVTAEYLAQIPS